MSELADDSRSRLVDAAIAEYLEQLERGTPPDEEDFLKQHVDIAEELRHFFTDYHALRPVDGHLPRIGDNLDADASVRRFGDYELFEEIGRGGMGVVYRARQVSLNRVVAVKMILAGRLASQPEVARFYAEARAAATLDHPAIVPVFEVGRLNGQHFFSMGYFAGRTLSDQLLDGPFKPREAASIMQEVATAVEFAHRKGIVHRDIKPANILIDADRRVRITDFGLAAVAAAESRLTVTGQVLGSPNFMSPEQIKGRKSEIGSATDIYSIGATLYALLSGRPPFQAASTVEVLKQVMDKDPVPLRQLDASLPRDLETITLKCLEKDSDRRYASAADLADDLRRFLDGRPVTAVPPSKFYEFGKFARRNRPLVAAAATVVFALAIGLTMLSIGLSRARTESRRANDALTQAQRINEFLTDLLTRASPVYDGPNYGREATVREVLDSASREIDTSLSDQPALEMSLRATIAAVYESLGVKENAHRHFARAAQLAESLGIGTLPVGIRCRLGRLRNLPIADAEASIPEARAVVDECVQRFGPDDVITIEAEDALGGVYGAARRIDEAKTVFDAALSRMTAGSSADPDLRMQMALGYAAALRESKLLRESNAVLEPFLPLVSHSTSAHNQVNYIRFLASIGSNFYDLGDFENAEKYYKLASAASLAHGGPNHFNSIVFTHWLARAIYSLKKYDEAERYERDAYGRAVRYIGPNNPVTLEMAAYLALILDNGGKPADAELFFRDVVQARRLNLPDGDAALIQSEANLAGNLMKLGRAREAVPILRDVYKWRNRLNESLQMPARIAGDLGLALYEIDNPSEAEPYLRESIQLRQQNHMPTTKTSRRIFAALANICDHTDRSDEAVQLRAAAEPHPTTQPS